MRKSSIRTCASPSADRRSGLRCTVHIEIIFALFNEFIIFNWISYRKFWCVSIVRQRASNTVQTLQSINHFVERISRKHNKHAQQIENLSHDLVVERTRIFSFSLSLQVSPNNFVRKVSSWRRDVKDDRSLSRTCSREVKRERATNMRAANGRTACI